MWSLTLDLLSEGIKPRGWTRAEYGWSPRGIFVHIADIY
jgi:hypothetical protein